MAFESWLFKQTHIISHGSGVTDYQVQFIIYKGSGTSSGNTIYCNGHCRDDFGDIIFVEGSNTSQCSFWIESYTSGVSCVYWVKLSSISTSGSTVSVYYGNNDALNYTSGIDTFIFFDDFTTLDTTTKWDIVKKSATTVAIESNQLKVTVPASAHQGGGIYAKSALPAASGYTIESYVKRTTYGNAGEPGTYVGLSDKQTIDTTYYGNYYEDNAQICPNYQYTGGKYSVAYGSSTTTLGSTGYVSPINAWVRCSAKIDIANKQTYGTFINGVNTYTINSSASTIVIDSNYLFLYYAEYNVSSSAFFDFIAVRTFALTEPTHGSYTTEQYVGPNEMSIVCTPSAGTPPLTTSIDIFIPYTLTNFELLYGDGQKYNSSSQTSFSTTHVYNTFGTYNIYAKGYSGSTLLEKYTQVSVSNNSLTASFTKNQNANIVTFTDTSISNPNEWYWTFGDGSTSTLKNPSHTYNTPGTYTITLYASNQQYNGFTSQTVTIANPSPTASITTTQHDDLLIPCHLTFEANTTTNASLNEHISTYSWALNGLPISTSHKFNKYFTTYGTQTIELAVTNNYGATYTTSTTVTLGALPIANFSPSLYSVLSPTLPYSVQFTNLSWPTDIPSTTYAWSFGDSGTSTSYNPSHSYTALGIYDVSLTITNPYGSDTITYNDAVRLSRKSKSFKEVTAIVDEFASVKIQGFDESAMPSDLPIVHATILNENFQVVQREIPNTPGLDEFGVSHISRTINTFGSKIINTLNEWGHKIIKAVTFNDHTGYSMYRAQEFKEEVNVTADAVIEK